VTVPFSYCCAQLLFLHTGSRGSSVSFIVLAEFFKFQAMVSGVGGPGNNRKLPPVHRHGAMTIWHVEVLSGRDSSDYHRISWRLQIQILVIVTSMKESLLAYMGSTEDESPHGEIDSSYP
jgi:hypothetical protein